MFFIAAIFAILACLLVFFVLKQGISVRWWEWLLAALGLALVIFTIQNFMGLLGENESKPAWLFWLYIGLPGIILIAIPAVLVAIRRNKA